MIYWWKSLKRRCWNNQPSFTKGAPDFLLCLHFLKSIGLLHSYSLNAIKPDMTLWFCMYSLTYKKDDFMYPSHLVVPSSLRPLVYSSIKFQRKGVCVVSARFGSYTQASPSCSIRAAHFRWQLTIFMVMAILSYSVILIGV